MSGSNASPPRSAPQTHTRTYQACIPCRRRKVRCDLGPVDNPHDPPCVRCRRESKECFFSATRRKRKQDGSDEADEQDDYEVRNARKRSRPSEAEHHDVASSGAAYGSQPLTPGGSVGRYEPLRRPTTSASMAPLEHSEEDIKVNNESVATLQTGEIYSGHDALNLLFEAARNGGMAMDMHHRRTGSTSSIHHPALASTPGSNFAASPQVTAPHVTSSSRAAADVVDPAITQPPQPQPQPPVLPDPPNEAAFGDAIKAWSKFRFVRAGWLTAKEAIAYIDYFYAYLSPLTPIVVPDYRDHAFHGKLLKEEPMLVITLLTIASRYSQPSGHTNAGAASRAYLIHEKLWKYLQGMIDRMIFGQEQFGGGFCGAGQQPGSDVNPLSRKGLRTLGTVESLMLLTEWHPRALHFPPGDDDDELVLPDGLDHEKGPKADMYKGVGDKRIDSWLEPCWRSDRMCWMLLGNAMTLAFEIGVFDETSETEFEQANQHLSHATVKAYFRRKNHLKNLLIIYVTQTSGRLGLTSMLPKIDQRDENFVGGPTPNELYQQRVSGIKAPPMQFGTRPSAGQDGQRLPLESVAHQERHAVQDLVLDFWTRIAKVMEMGNLKLFSNRRKTRELLKSGQYEDMLKFFQAPLMEWKNCFDRAPQGTSTLHPSFQHHRRLTPPSPHSTPPRPHHRIRIHPRLPQLACPASRRRALHAQHPLANPRQPLRTHSNKRHSVRPWRRRRHPLLHANTVVRQRPALHQRSHRRVAQRAQSRRRRPIPGRLPTPRTSTHFLPDRLGGDNPAENLCAGRHRRRRRRVARPAVRRRRRPAHQHRRRRARRQPLRRPRRNTDPPHPQPLRAARRQRIDRHLPRRFPLPHPSPPDASPRPAQSNREFLPGLLVPALPSLGAGLQRPRLAVSRPRAQRPRNPHLPLPMGHLRRAVRSKFKLHLHHAAAGLQRVPARQHPRQDYQYLQR